MLHCRAPVADDSPLLSQRKGHGMLWIEPSKRERKTNYSVDSYYKEAMSTGPAKVAKPRVPRAPKQLAMSVLVKLLASLAAR